MYKAKISLQPVEDNGVLKRPIVYSDAFNSVEQAENFCERLLEAGVAAGYTLLFKMPSMDSWRYHELRVYAPEEMARMPVLGQDPIDPIDPRV